MQLPDVNVLIYAHRQDAPEHDRYAAWLRALVEAPEPFAVAEIVLARLPKNRDKSQDLSAGDADAKQPWYFAAGSSSGHEPSSSIARLASIPARPCDKPSRARRR